MIATLLLLASMADIDWQTADRNVTRLPPSTFRQLPPNIRSELQQRRCRIPQLWGNRPPHNVIRGHFTSKAANEWAVLCSVRRTSTILVFREGESKPFAELERARDVGYLQTIIDDRPGYSRKISRITPKDIIGYCKLEQHKCPPIAHDGIENVFEDKASTIFYYSGGKWLELEGAD